MSLERKLVGAINIVFRRNVERDRRIILQSNTRAGAVAQFISAVIGAAGIVVAVVLPRENVHITVTAQNYGLISLALFVVMVASLVVILWPRKLGNLPKDKSVEAYQARIREEAEASLVSSLPTQAEYKEGYVLQGIGRLKERATQSGLASTLLFVGFFTLTVASLKY